MKLSCKNDQLVVFSILYEFIKWSSFATPKKKTPITNQSFVVYEFTYPGCGANYVGKIETTLYERCI